MKQTAVGKGGIEMASYQKQLTKRAYPVGSVSNGTMRPEDLIPAFVGELAYRLKYGSKVGRETRKQHAKLVRDIETRMNSPETVCTCNGWCECHNHKLPKGESCDCSAKEPDGFYYDSEQGDNDLDSLFEALGEYTGPYFYFGAHPGDGADYGYWLSEDWDEEFHDCTTPGDHACTLSRDVNGESIKVSDLADVPSWFRGEVAVVSDYGLVTLYVKTSRKLTEVWSVI